MGGEGSGRLPKLSTIVNKTLKRDTKNVPKYFEKLAELALRGDKDCLQYLIDRHLGRPHQSQDLRITAKRIYSPEELQLMSGPVLNEASLLKEWSEDGQEGTNQIESTALQGKESVTE